MKKLLLDQFVGKGQWCHYARPRIEAGDFGTPHTHDFHEVFWIEAGQGVHRVNGIEQELRVGKAVLIAADDAHGFGTAAGESFQTVNIAFHTATWSYLQDRYFPDDPDPLIARPVERRTFELPEPAHRQLNGYAGEIAQGARSRVAIERFLLNLMHLMRSDVPQATSDDARRWPDWLARACREVGAERRFAGGTRELARLAGKSPEHLARELRRVCGKTPTDIVNEARMTYAASRLATTGDEILDIVLDCGLDNLGHFYQLFRARYGMTPRKYRLREQRIVRPHP